MRASLVRPLPFLAGLVLLGCRDATGPQSPVDPAVRAAYAAPCLRPAPLRGTYTPEAPGVIVQVKAGTAVEAEVVRLSAAYAFTPRFIYTHAYEGFSADLPAATIADLRCEPSVQAVEWDAVVTHA